MIAGKFQVGLIFILGLLSTGSSSRVLELSDRFVEIAKDGQWLIMFYAPWCGHCKRLEPIWSHVAQSLHNTNIRVGRVDCTRFTSMATEFKVQGFPTIMFLKGASQYTFKGDRTKEDIMNFATRVSGPPVQHITRPESLDNLKAANQLFFVFVGEREGDLWGTYAAVAERFQPHGFFYSVSNDIASNHVKVPALPCVFVYKEGRYYFFQDLPSVAESGPPRPTAPEAEGAEGLEALNATLHDWVNAERFPTFPKVTRGNIHQMLQTRKNLVLAVVEENKLLEVAPEMLEFREMVESVIRGERHRFHTRFQFGWVGSPELANSIAMSVLPLPCLLVVNSTTNHHHLPEDHPSQLTPQAVALFLEAVHNDSVHAYGGDGLGVRAYRALFEARTALSDMWRGNPVLTALLFGLPLGFLALICYSVCCADLMDADPDTDQDGGHEKND